VGYWWRCSALEALLSFIRHGVSTATVPDAPSAAAAIAAGLAPLLEACGAGQPSSRAGAPGAFQLLAAFTTMQLRLFECYAALPFGAPAGHGEQLALVKACLMAARRLGGAYGSPAAAAALGPTVLRGLLHGQEAMLGPWLPGADLLQDELRAFSGARAAPRRPQRAGLMSRSLQGSWGARGSARAPHSEALFPPSAPPQASAAGRCATPGRRGCCTPRKPRWRRRRAAAAAAAAWATRPPPARRPTPRPAA
jgi:hypothetical protein